MRNRTRPGFRPAGKGHFPVLPRDTTTIPRIDAAKALLELAESVEGGTRMVEITAPGRLFVSPVWDYRNYNQMNLFKAEFVAALARAHRTFVKEHPQPAGWLGLVGVKKPTPTITELDVLQSLGENVNLQEVHQDPQLGKKTIVFSFPTSAELLDTVPDGKAKTLARYIQAELKRSAEKLARSNELEKRASRN